MKKTSVNPDVSRVSVFLATVRTKHGQPFAACGRLTVVCTHRRGLRRLRACFREWKIKYEKRRACSMRRLSFISLIEYRVDDRCKMYKFYPNKKRPSIAKATEGLIQAT
jgi:hypothetical protein